MENILSLQEIPVNYSSMKGYAADSNWPVARPVHCTRHRHADM